MDLTLADGVVFWIYLALFCLGLLAWTWGFIGKLQGRSPAAISPRPDEKAITFGGELILFALLGYILLLAALGQVVGWLNLSFTGSDEIINLSKGLVVDIVAKSIMIVALAYFIKTRISREIFFQASKALTFLQVIVVSLLVYFAIFPLINEVVLKLSVFVINDLLHISSPEKHQAFELLDNPDVSNYLKAGTLLLAAVISPIAEELFFRGLIQNILYKLFRSPFAAIMVTACLFMAVHVPMYEQLPALGVLGAILGWSYYRYRSLAVPIVIHIIFNSVTLLFWWLGVEN
jgi:CAAX protease family protein